MKQPADVAERINGNAVMLPPAAEIEVRCGSVICLWRFGKAPAVVRAILYRRGSKHGFYFRVGPFGGNDALEFEHLPQNPAKLKLFIDKSVVVEVKQTYFISAVVDQIYSDANVELERLKRVERLVNAADEEAASAESAAPAIENAVPPPPVINPVPIVVQQQVAPLAVHDSLSQSPAPHSQAIVAQVERRGGLLHQYAPEEIFSPAAAGQQSRRVNTMTQIARRPAGFDLTAINAGFTAMTAAITTNNENQRQLQLALVEAMASNRRTADAAIAAASASSEERKLFLQTLTSQRDHYEQKLFDAKKAADDEKRELNERLREERERSDARAERLTEAFISNYAPTTSPSSRKSQ